MKFIRSQEGRALPLSNVFCFTKTKKLLLLLILLQLNLIAFAQMVSVQGRKIPIKETFKMIKKQTGCAFFYEPELLQETTPVTINIKNRSLEDALKVILKNQPINFNIQGNTVFITKRIDPAQDKIQKQDKESRQVIYLRGVIIGERGKGVAGATIQDLTLGPGAITDENGSFLLENINMYDEIIISNIGYKTIRFKVVSAAPLVITLTPDIKDLKDAVVIGYGSVRKKDLTGSVSVIDNKQIQDVPFLSVDNAIAGKAAGVQITKTDGSPGGAVRVRVRGSTSLLGGNDPLYVIDGVPLQVQSNYINPGFDFINPSASDVSGGIGVSAGMSTAFVNGLNNIGGLNVDDIESISILKDASATAIYGSKAANGVVIITTKSGRKDMKPQIMFSDYATYSVPVLPDLLNAEQYKTLMQEAAKNDYDYKTNAGLSFLISPTLNAIVNHPDTFFKKGNTDWLSLVTRKVMADNAMISVQGGSAASKYYTSISYNSTPGVMKGSDYQRISGKINIENEIGSHLKFITNIDLGYVEQNITNGAYSQALRARPDLLPYDSSGNFTDFSKVGASYQGYQNPVALLKAINNSKTFSLLGSISGIYDFSPALQFKSTVSLNMQTYNQRNYTPSFVALGGGLYLGNVANNGGIGSNSNSRMSNWFVENTLTFNKTFNTKHSLNILAGTSYETDKSSYFSATGQGYPNDDILNNLSSAVTPISIRGDDPTKPQSYLISYYLRANYGYNDKYLLTFTGRADGSSKFGPENKFGYFPSGAVAWRISKENFLKNVSWIDDIKFRGSYGVTGTQNIGNQMYRTLYSPYSYGGISALIPTQLGNPSIKWETTKETDAGLDFAFFGNRLQGTLDYYKKNTSNALLSLPVAPSSSYSTLLGNVAGLSNTGFEVSLQGYIIRNKNFQWTTSLNITWSKTRVTKLDPSADLTQIGNLTGIELGNTTLIEGKPLGLITGIAKVDGIIKSQQQLDDYKAQLGGYADIMFPYLSLGDPMFMLDSSDGFGRYPTVNPVIGTSAPHYFGGFTQEFKYKNLSLSLYFTYSEGGHLMWGDDVSALNFTSIANANAIALDRYNEQNTGSTHPRLLLYDQLFMNNTNLSLYKSSYIKLRTITFNYSFGKSGWMKKAGIQGASLFASATNLFTITSYPGNDPETSDDPYSVTGGNFDVSNYPTIRSFSAGFKIFF